jgi:serine/threonine-protein kinase
MSRLKRLIAEVHKRSIWQSLAVYLLGAAAAYQVIQSLTEGLDLPVWLPGFSVVLFVVLLPVVLAAAVVREETHAAKTPAEATTEPEAGAAATEAGPVATTRAPAGRRVLTWRRVALGLVYVFALWGAIAAGWLALEGRLQQLSRAPEGAETRTMLAVLPFENLGATEDDYFADGVTEEITSRLAEIPDLGVISRTSAIQYKDSHQSLRQIAEELGVEYVLEGSVRWDRLADGRSRVRVTPQLVRVSDDTNIWTERYDAVLSEIFQVQSDIAESVARALDITLLEPQRQALETQPTQNLEAYDRYLRGNELYGRRFVEEEARAAVEMYESAVELDSSFASAYAALGRALVWLNQQFGRSGELPRARQAVDEALRLAPDLADAHMALGDYYYYGQWDFEQALEQYQWVQRRQPSNSDAIALTAWIQRRQGDWENSIVNAERALELDPRNTVWLIGQAQNHFYLRQYAQAEPYFLRTIALAPDVPYYHRWAAWYYLTWDGTTERAQRLLEQAFYRIDPSQLLVGSEASWIILNVFGEDYAPSLELTQLGSPDVDSAYYYLAKAQVYAQTDRASSARAYYDSARVVLEERVRGGPQQIAPYAELGLAYAGLGRKEEAIREGRRAVQLLPSTRDAMTGPDRERALAQIYVIVGEFDLAIDQLQHLLSIPSQFSAGSLYVDPFWDPLRSIARFQAMLEGRI